jgi:tetratricopeptide (TPR) repeat protein
MAFRRPDMPAFRHMKRSIFVLAAIALVWPAAAAAGEQSSVQKLIERGALQEAVDRAASESDNVESTYLAAQALIKMDDNSAAEERYGRLRETGDDAWKAIGESGAKLLAGDVDGAMDAANRAVEANGENPYAHYQLGLVASKRNDFTQALKAYSRAIGLRSDMAYAHYYAGQAALRLKRMAEMSDHFRHFLRLAPEAPERHAVQSILRTLR